MGAIIPSQIDILSNDDTVETGGDVDYAETMSVQGTSPPSKQTPPRAI